MSGLMPSINFSKPIYVSYCRQGMWGERTRANLLWFYNDGPYWGWMYLVAAYGTLKENKWEHIWVNHQGVTPMGLHAVHNKEFMDMAE